MLLSKILLCIAVILACASVSMAKAAQGDLMGLANEVAVERYAKQYIGHPEGKNVLKGILWVESKYGKYKTGEGSFGIAQIEVPTARYVAKRFGFKIPRAYKAIKDLLIRDDRMSIQIAAAYLGLLEHRFASMDQAVVAYNIGPAKLWNIAKNGGKLPASYHSLVMEAANKELRTGASFPGGISSTPSKTAPSLINLTASQKIGRFPAEYLDQIMAEPDNSLSSQTAFTGRISLMPSAESPKTNLITGSQIDPAGLMAHSAGYTASLSLPGSPSLLIFSPLGDNGQVQAGCG